MACTWRGIVLACLCALLARFMAGRDDDEQLGADIETSTGGVISVKRLAETHTHTHTHTHTTLQHDHSDKANQVANLGGTSLQTQAVDSEASLGTSSGNMNQARAQKEIDEEATSSGCNPECCKVIVTRETSDGKEINDVDFYKDGKLVDVRNECQCGSIRRAFLKDCKNDDYKTLEQLVESVDDQSAPAALMVILTQLADPNKQFRELNVARAVIVRIRSIIVGMVPSQSEGVALDVVAGLEMLLEYAVSLNLHWMWAEFRKIVIEKEGDKDKNATCCTGEKQKVWSKDDGWLVQEDRLHDKCAGELKPCFQGSSFHDYLNKFVLPLLKQYLLKLGDLHKVYKEEIQQLLAESFLPEQEKVLDNNNMKEIEELVEAVDDQRAPAALMVILTQLPDRARGQLKTHEEKAAATVRINSHMVRMVQNRSEDGRVDVVAGLQRLLTDTSSVKGLPWLHREFRKIVLEQEGNKDDFQCCKVNEHVYSKRDGYDRSDDHDMCHGEINPCFQGGTFEDKLGHYVLPLLKTALLEVVDPRDAYRNEVQQLLGL